MVGQKDAFDNLRIVKDGTHNGLIMGMLLYEKMGEKRLCSFTGFQNQEEVGN